MPTLGNALDFAKYEARNIRAHVLGTAPSSPVTGQMYYNSADNTLWWWDGSQWVSARGGAAATPPATTGALGTIQLAGDLAGTATSPQIAAGVITDADVNAANKDGASGTPSMRRTGSGVGQVMPGDRSLNYINDNFVPMNGNLGMAGFKVTGLADPTVASDSATKQYVDNTTQGLDAKPSVRAASTGNLTLSGTQTVDGVALVANDRALVKDQSTLATNGIYVVAAGAWTRAADMDAWAEVPGAFTFVEQGTVNADTGWISSADQGGTLGTTAITWVQFSAAGQIVGGAGLLKTGQTLDVGAGAGITVNPDTIQVATNGITNAMIADGAINLATADVTGLLPVSQGGTGAATAQAARSGLGAPGVPYQATGPPSTGATWAIPRATHLQYPGRGNLVQVADETSGAVELPDIVIGAGGDVTITWGASVTLNTKRVVIFGA